MIRVLQVVGCLERGGTEAFIMNLYRYIDRTKIQFDFLVLFEKDYPYLEEIKSLGGNVYFGVPFRKNRIGSFLKRCITIMKQTPYAAVHSHINLMNGWILFAAKWAGIATRVSHSHDAYGKNGRFDERLLHRLEIAMIKRYANVFLACSEHAGIYLYGEERFLSKGQVVKNGIDVDKFFQDDEIAKDVKLPSSTSLVFGNISRFEAKKNQLFLLDIFSHILRQEPQAILLLGGVDGGQLEICVEKAQHLGIEKQVKFIGVRQDMPQVLRMVDVYVFPSLYEGLGIVLLEAQAAGCYCVASTACPIDSDMGLGRIDYIPLQQDSYSWARRILNGYGKVAKKRPTNEEIYEAFDKKGYSIPYLVKHMTDIYTGAIKS